MDDGSADATGPGPGGPETGGSPSAMPLRREVVLLAGGVAAALLVALAVLLAAGSGGVGGGIGPRVVAATDATAAAPSTSAPTPTTSAPNLDDPEPATGTTIRRVTTTLPESAPPTTDSPPPTPPELDEDDPAVVARPVPVEPPPPPPEAPPPPWAASTTTNANGIVSTDVGCANDPTAGGIDAFFAERVGPVLGWDYQHAYDLGGGRHLWLFQDTFVDHSGTAETLDKASFVHNTALLQEGVCFRLLHRGSPSAPAPFEPGTGTRTLGTWFWPMGGEVHGDLLYVFWAEMHKDPVDPVPPDGLGWHPVATHLAIYDPLTLVRLDFRRATDPGVTPIYGYAVASDATHTYLFGNTFEQNLTREGGWWNGPHSATEMYLARVPRGRLVDAPEYWTGDGWAPDADAARPFLSRHWVEFPMQPRFLGGQWVAAAAINGYWGEEYSIDVAPDPWGPWTTVEAGPLIPRGADPAKNTYHAHLAPWRDGFGSLIVTVSNNARDMLADAWPHPERYRPMAFYARWQEAPPRPTTTVPPSSTTSSPVTTVSTQPSTTAPTTVSTTLPTTVGPSTAVPTTSSLPPGTTVPPTSTAPSTTSRPTTTVGSPTTTVPTPSTSPSTTSSPSTSSSTVSPSSAPAPDG